MEKSMEIPTNNSTGFIETILVITFTSMAHIFENIQPFLSVMSALTAITVGITTIIINWPKLKSRLKLFLTLNNWLSLIYTR